MAFLIRITFVTPISFVTFEQALTVVLALLSKGTTPTGLPRNRLSHYCSTDAKKPSKSRYSRSIVSGRRIETSEKRSSGTCRKCIGTQEHIPLNVDMFLKCSHFEKESIRVFAAVEIRLISIG